MPLTVPDCHVLDNPHPGPMRGWWISLSVFCHLVLLLPFQTHIKNKKSHYVKGIYYQTAVCDVAATSFMDVR